MAKIGRQRFVGLPACPRTSSQGKAFQLQRCRQQDAARPQGDNHGCDNGIAPVRADRFFQRHLEKGARVFPASKPEVQICLQFDKMFVTGLSAPGVTGKLFDPSPNLVSNKSQHIFWRRFIHADDPAWIAEVRKVYGKAEPVCLPASLPDQRQVLGRKCVVPDDRRRVCRRIEQRRARLR